jgi:hypothetical protein
MARNEVFFQRKMTLQIEKEKIEEKLDDGNILF